MDGVYITRPKLENTASLWKQSSLIQGRRAKVGLDGDCQHFHLDVELATFVCVPLAKGKYCGQALEWQRCPYPTEFRARLCCWSHLPEPEYLARCHSLSVCQRKRKPHWKVESWRGPRCPCRFQVYQVHPTRRGADLRNTEHRQMLSAPPSPAWTGLPSQTQ